MPCSKMSVKSGRNLEGNNNKNSNVGDERSGMQVPVPPERYGGGDEAMRQRAVVGRRGRLSEIRPHRRNDRIDFRAQPVEVTGFPGFY